MSIQAINQIVAISFECLHPTLTMETSLDRDRVIWCPACQKKVVIPLATELSMTDSDLVGIVGLAFGERWKQIIEKWMA